MARLTLPGLSLPGITPDQPGQSKLAKWGPTIAMVVLVAIAAWLATRWFWYFWPQATPPAPPARADRGPAIAQVAETVAASQIFGASAQAPAQVSTSTLNVKLKGVFAAGNENRPAAAILNVGQKDEFVRTGNEVVPGVTLDAVFPTHVILKRSGRLERVNLEERIEGGGGVARPTVAPPRRLPPPSPNAPSLPPPQSNAPPANQAVPPPFPPVAPPAGGPTPGLAPGAPSGGAMPLQQGQSGNFGSVVPTSAGVTVQSAPPGSILASIGLQQGDVIKSVGGQAISGTADLARLYGQTSNGQTVAGEIIRGGKTMPITITVRR